MICFRVRRPSANLFDSKRNLVLLVVFLLLLPKGGFKILNIPITWGYLLLGIFSMGALFRNPISVHRERLNVLIALAPFLVISAMTMAINGIHSPEMACAFWVSFLVLPCLFFLFFSKDIETLSEPLFYRLFTRGIFYLSLYGIFLFFFKQLTGRFLEIPFLTININDFGRLAEKCIDRGSVFKLISTYNNGNIYGLCLLMLLPLYCLFEPSRWKPWVVKLSLLMTMSRTVWIGLFFHEICYQLLISKSKNHRLIRAFNAFSILTAILLFLTSHYGFYWSFFADPNLGGRKSQLEAFFNTGFVSTESFGGISEIVYAGILTSFGWIGLIAYLFAMSGPLFYQIISRPQSPSQQCIALGLIIYLVISASDGAILYLPTLAFYWFLLSFLFRKNWMAQTI